MTNPSKARVRQSFERAASTYDSAADIQRRICTQLAAGLPEITPTRLLDAGCGTGYAQTDLQARFPRAHAVALDLSPAMLDRVAAPCCRLAGDLENLPLADACLDLYWSSLAVQWCDLATALREAHRTLRPAGQLALASLGPATFHELRYAFADVDDYRHTLTFHSEHEVRKIAGALGFSAINTKKNTKIAHYADFKTLLRAVKAIGANQLGDGRRTSLMSRANFQRAEAAYELLRTPAGLPLSYDVIYLYAKK
ncbi:malonyl-ACP O-methyltransferase BioC [Dechloromonas sp. HYN0024]|uniref:malonyl-ACP O-methyltransferase BioC n=1 Tax=Dechloromonas sp. HYN0024 TaxID=2231055 RepID=UPI000E4429D3|nr:malonyl-ACP O-methyltransferase BioC [Dechloromonas sp. HYN0024]AXS80296.1 malonyl-[acyl-carrier protein] O-methyltransferase BioC [Dechloromonas sp. HYN0024]